MENVERELGKLVLSNLEMLEKSYGFLVQIDVQFYEKIENQFNAWYEDFKKNSGWHKKPGNKKNQDAIWYCLGEKYDNKKSNIDIDYSWLSACTGIAKYDDGETIEYGIHFGFNRDYFNFTAKTAKQFMQDQFANYPELKEVGFQYIVGSSEHRTIFLPIQLDLKLLIEEYPDYKDQALQPLSDALDKIKNHQAVFDGIAEKLMKHSKLQES
ncbi:hypothetical protein [Neisseria sicca]|jgi:hypothetical protein|uniref:Uncharacterized protein n=1 Tax=Neisseria sicca VK64 TaxID=1095748 RepID=I2NVD7_NEISI|nr:hypothetical protein [Neisseria sicca]EIG29798.1 hypothetical protein HMPREF1051_2096 [Neisseria sicca VK64]